MKTKYALIFAILAMVANFIVVIDKNQWPVVFSLMLFFIVVTVLDIAMKLDNRN